MGTSNSLHTNPKWKFYHPNTMATSHWKNDQRPRPYNYAFFDWSVELTRDIAGAGLTLLFLVIRVSYTASSWPIKLDFYFLLSTFVN